MCGCAGISEAFRYAGPQVWSQELPLQRRDAAWSLRERRLAPVGGQEVEQSETLWTSLRMKKWHFRMSLRGTRLKVASWTLRFEDHRIHAQCFKIRCWGGAAEGGTRVSLRTVYRTFSVRAWPDLQYIADSVYGDGDPRHAPKAQGPVRRRLIHRDTRFSTNQEPSPLYSESYGRLQAHHLGIRLQN